MSAYSYPDPQRPVTDAQLQAFVTVVDQGGFTPAARQLQMSQSAVSHAVAALEKSLQVDLLVRNARGVQPTDIGRRVAEHAREALRRKALMRQEAETASGLREGVVTVGSFGPTSSRHLLPPILQGFAQRHPGLEVRMIEGSDQEVEQWLREGRVDLGFIDLPNDEFDAAYLARDEWVALLPADCPLASQHRIRPPQLSDYPFILSTGGCEEWVQKLLSQNSCEIRYQIREVQMIVEMVGQGLGVSLKPALSLPDPPPPSVVYRPLLPSRPREVGLAFVNRNRLSPAARAFLKAADASRRINTSGGTIGQS